jgi:thymidylate kinase
VRGNTDPINSGGIVMRKAKKLMKIVSFDGISGTGKSQIMRLLMGYFKTMDGTKVAGFSENLIAPEREQLAERVESLRLMRGDGGSLEEDVEFTRIVSCDRAYISRTLIPMLSSQTDREILFIDRWTPTNMAYQSLNGLTPDEIYQMHREKGVMEPDLHVILTCPVELAVERVDKRATKKVRGVAGKMSTVISGGMIDVPASFEKKKRIQEAFFLLPDILGKDRCIVFDTDRSYDQIIRKLVPIVTEKLFGYNPAYSPHFLERLDEIEFSEYPFDHMVISG